MKEITVDQGSPAWLSWRKTVITATDCPAILGSSPWSTAYKCWQRKLGLIEEQKSNEAMENGKKLEPFARVHFIESFGIDMTPMVVESSEFDFLGASLDGISIMGNYLLEIKCGGQKLYNLASHGIIPDYYLDQIQHQLLVTRSEKCYYYAMNPFFQSIILKKMKDEDLLAKKENREPNYEYINHDLPEGEKGKVIEVLPDPTFIDRFMPKARAFWKSVAFFEAPPLQDSDYMNMNDNLDWAEYAKMYRETDAAIKALEDKKDYLRKKLIEMCGDQSCTGTGIKVIKTLVKGRVAYDEIPEIKNIDLDKYRKNSTTSWKILVDEKK